jgi:hypothetical protein
MNKCPFCTIDLSSSYHKMAHANWEEAQLHKGEYEQRRNGNQFHFEELTHSTLDTLLEQAWFIEQFDPTLIRFSPEDHERIGKKVLEGTTCICEKDFLFTHYINQTTGRLITVMVSPDVQVGTIMLEVKVVES